MYSSQRAHPSPAISDRPGHEMRRWHVIYAGLLRCGRPDRYRPSEATTDTRHSYTSYQRSRHYRYTTSPSQENICHDNYYLGPFLEI